MSSIPTSNELNNAECEKGHVTQRPPIPHATSKVESTMKASRETIKMKTPEGEVKVTVLGDSPGAEEYLQHLNALLRMLARKKYKVDLLKLTNCWGRNSPCEAAFKSSKRRERPRDGRMTQVSRGRKNRAPKSRGQQERQGGARLRTLSQGPERRSRFTMGSHH